MPLRETGKALHLWNRGHWRDYLFSQLMLLMAAVFLAFFISIGLGVNAILQRFLATDLPAEQVRVSPPGMQAGFFQTELGGLEITDSLKTHRSTPMCPPTSRAFSADSPTTRISPSRE
jgi:hypothetical protein